MKIMTKKYKPKKLKEKIEKKEAELRKKRSEARANYPNAIDRILLIKE